MKELIIPGLDKNQTNDLTTGLREQLMHLEGHQDAVLIEYLLVLLGNGHNCVRIKSELETFLSSPEHADRLSRWLFDRYELFKHGKLGQPAKNEPNKALKSIVMSGVSIFKAGKPAGRTFRSAIENVIRPSTNSGNEVVIRDARDIINLRKKHSEDVGRLNNTTMDTMHMHNTIQTMNIMQTKSLSAHQDHMYQCTNLENVPNASAFSPPKKCKAFPDCPDPTCPHVHPKETCKYFPNCMYGDECLFIHPLVPCRFTDRCTNTLCNYMHPVKEKIVGTSIVIPQVGPQSSILCKFNARCRRHDCPFLHTIPAPCPHGTQCLRPACPFTHPSDHPPPPPRSLVNRPCRFGKACAKSDCPYLHPERASISNKGE